MRDDSDFPHTNCGRVLFFQQKVDHSLNSPKSYCCLLLIFQVFLYVHSMLRTYSMKKSFTFVSLLPFTKKKQIDLVMTPVRLIMTVILTLFLFRFVVNVQDLHWDTILVLNMNRRRNYTDFFAVGKNDQLTPPSPHVYNVLK